MPTTHHNRKAAYQEYLQSEYWANLKAITKKPPECSGCARAVPLQLHHLYYRETWQDSCPKDLLWICAECHTLFHMAFGTNLKRETTYLKSSRAFIRRFAVSFLRAAATELGYASRLSKGGKGTKGSEVRRILESIRTTENWSKLRGVEVFTPPPKQSPLSRLSFPVRSLPASIAELEASRTDKGGWGRKQLAEWGVPWPPPKGWKSRLESRIQSKSPSGMSH